MPRFQYRRTGESLSRFSTTPQAFFTYFGGKHSFAHRYPLPRHDLIVEPFAGSAAYSTLHHKHEVLLIDKYPAVTDTWKWLVESTAADVLNLPLVATQEMLGSLPDGARNLIMWWMKKGETRPSLPSTRFKGGLRPDSHWGSVIRHRLAKNVAKIKHWQVLCGDYREAPNVEATWFIDPPYQRSGKSYVESDVDYQKLARWVKSLSGQVIACGQLGDDWLPFRPLLLARNIRGGAGGQEMIWTN